MDFIEKTFLYILLVVAGIVAGNALVRAVWRILSALRVRQDSATNSTLRGKPVLWRDPGEIEKLDLFHGPGGPLGKPEPPFHYLEEHSTGSSPSISVRDARGRVWRIKWGDEVNTENFCTRFAWACGYFVETTYFLSEGRIEGVRQLDRAKKCLDEKCNFRDARFELDEKGMNKFFEEKSWSWNDNPFINTRELNGLKILFMLLSNWDNKDLRDVARGSNTAIFHCEDELRYLIIDWGAAMGKWGTNFVSRGKWDCDGYAAQNPNFVKMKPDGSLVWGFLGQRTEDIAQGITIDDVRWLYHYAGRIRDDQIRDALTASGADSNLTECFTNAIRDRLNTLQKLTKEAKNAKK